MHRLGAQRSPEAIAIGDLNGDGNADALTANRSDSFSDFSALLGDGTGGVDSPVDSGHSGNLGSSISLGDLDGDGFLDTVIKVGGGLIVQGTGKSPAACYTAAARDGVAGGVCQPHI